MIYGVSLGPGDPLLITVKGLQVLQQVDRIYYPGSVGGASYSLGILKHYNLDESKFRGMFLQMSDDRQQAEDTYATTFASVLADHQAGLNVAFVSEGDISFYSTFAYLLKHIQQHKLEVEIIAGVPSFLLGTAVHKMPLAVLNEKIAILPRVKDLERYLEEFDTLVLIKVRSVIRTVMELVLTRGLNIVYCERLGTAQQYITTDIDDLKGREIPYFSLLILKKI